MSTISSSEEGSGTAGHYAASSGLESTGSLLSSLPTGSSDVQTDITPPTSPTASDGKIRTPRDILDASRRLGQISALMALQGDPDRTPTKLPKQFRHLPPSVSIADDEAGYDADGDGDGEGDADERARASAGTTAPTKPIRRRPTFLRIDTRQHRRVASMLATRRPTSPDLLGDTGSPRHAPWAKLPSVRPKHSATKVTAFATHAESYELRRRPKAEPVGLGIGFPESHPLRSRAFTTPVPASASTVVASANPGLEEGEKIQERWSGWRLRSRSPTRSKKKTAQVGPGPGAVYAPSPVRLVLQPTFLEVSPSPMECLPAWTGAGTFRCDDARDRNEIERRRCRALAREGRPVLGSRFV
ncbi:hypothetical protein HD554DRAFT_2174047 [Boletus coccyginus]|nr:hypothetical protein HD554DRAFT_2174047 [Boletus coccyginus]